MGALRIAIIVAVGALVAGFVILTLGYPIVKTVEGWFEAIRTWAFGTVPEVGVTLADGGEKAEGEEKKE